MDCAKEVISKKEGGFIDLADAARLLLAEPFLLPPSLAIACCSSPLPSLLLHLFFYNTEKKLDIRKKRRKIYVLSFSMLKALLGD